MSNRLFIGVLAVVLAASLSEACHPTGNVGTGTAGNGSQGTAVTAAERQGAESAGTSGDAGRRAAPAPREAPARSTRRRARPAARASAAPRQRRRDRQRGQPGAGGVVTTADMIDHLDDGDARIIMVNGRQGPWHSFSEPAGGNIQPPSDAGFFSATVA